LIANLENTDISKILIRSEKLCGLVYAPFHSQASYLIFKMNIRRE